MGLSLQKLKDNFIKKLKLKKNNEFELLGAYEGSKCRTLFKHKVCGYEWETTPVSLLHSKGVGCPNCKVIEQSLSHEQFVTKLKTIYNGEFEVAKGHKYHGMRSELVFFHKKCGGTFSKQPYLLTKQGSCDNCRGNLTGGRKKTHEQFVRQLKELRDGEYVLSKGSIYTSALGDVNVTHLKCGESFTVRASHILYSSGCPRCNISKGEELVAKVLKQAGVTFTREFKFNDCIDKKELPFDFAIINNLGDVTSLIEYDGSQHFISYKHFGGDKKLEITQRHDNIKNKYASDNNIPLLRIPYYLTKKEVVTNVLNFIQEK